MLFWMTATLLIYFAAWFLLYRLIYLPRVVRIFEEVPWLQATANQPLDDSETARFPSRDGVELCGSYLRTSCKHRKGILLFCHELTGDRWGVLSYLRELNHEGYDIFTFDFRNHGESDFVPDYQPSQWLTEYELNDVEAAVNYLVSRQDYQSTPIAALGISRGGTAALALAARDSQISAVVTDGAFPLIPMIVHYTWKYVRIYTVFAPLLFAMPIWWLKIHMTWPVWVAERRNKCRFVYLEQLIKQVKQPVLMLHGGSDRHIPMEVVRPMADSLARLTELHIFPKAKHNRSIQTAKSDYLDKLRAFFQTALNSDNHRNRPPSTYAA